MQPNRSVIVNGHSIEEYYWGGKFVIYIDNKISIYSFQEAIDIYSVMDNYKNQNN